MFLIYKNNFYDTCKRLNIKIIQYIIKDKYIYILLALKENSLI